MLVTGATGLVGSHVVERAAEQGVRLRALVRPASDTAMLERLGVERIMGDMSDALGIQQAVDGATVIVHCAAKVGDWGPTDEYREVNVQGTKDLLLAAESSGSLKRFVHISSLGVYEARDHYGTDETEKTNTDGIDGYTLTKIEADRLVLRHARKKDLPAVVLRPGFIYGPRDRTVIPRILERLKDGKFRFLGTTDKLMNNTFVGNLVDAVSLAISCEDCVGQAYNIHDGRLVTKQEFFHTIAELAKYNLPEKVVPLGVAKSLAFVLENAWKLLGMQQAPILSSARIKFLGLNLDFSIDKARQQLGYNPRVDYAEGMKQTIDWFRQQGRV